MGRQGQIVCRVRRTRLLSRFDGERDITTLETFPVHLKVDGNKVPLIPDRWNELVKRGEKYWEYMKKGCVQVTYNGKILGTPQYVVSVCIPKVSSAFTKKIHSIKGRRLLIRNPTIHRRSP